MRTFYTKPRTEGATWRYFKYSPEAAKATLRPKQQHAGVAGPDARGFRAAAALQDGRERETDACAGPAAESQCMTNWQAGVARWRTDGVISALCGGSRGRGGVRAYSQAPSTRANRGA